MDINLNDKLTSLQEISKCQLSKILNSCSKPKDLILEQSIIRPLESVCGVRWLRGNGVDKIYKLEAGSMNSKADAVFYMIYSNVNVFRQVVDQIRSMLDLEKPTEDKFHVIIVPKSLYIFEEILEELGLIQTVIKLFSFQWQPICLDTRVLSLEVSNMYSSLYVQQDHSLLSTFSRNLWHMFFTFGRPKLTITLGHFSEAVFHQLNILCENVAETDKLNTDFGSLIIMDRSVDYVSALLTPCTYAALLNEVYGVTCGVCEYKSEETETYDSKCNPVVKKNSVSFPLSSKQDSVYSDIKNRHFTEVTSVLISLTKKLQSEGQNLKEMVLDEIKQYIQTQLQVSKSKKKMITTHLTAAETIINVMGPRFEVQQEVERNILLNRNKSGNFSYLEEMLTTENDKYVSLRLFCLMCITQKLTEGEIKSFWHKYLTEYGFKYGFVHSNLMNTGFIGETTLLNLPNIINKIPKLNQNNFYSIGNKLKQIPNDPSKISVKNPTCCSYVFGGCYIPLITQIANMLFHTTPLDEIKNKLEGLGKLSIHNDRGYPLEHRSVLIYIIGGVTYAEIAACNLLESLTGTKIVLLSERIISGNDIMKSLFELFGNIT